MEKRGRTKVFRNEGNYCKGERKHIRYKYRNRIKGSGSKEKGTNTIKKEAMGKKREVPRGNH